MKRQTFSDVNGSYLDKSDVGSNEVLAVKRIRWSFVRKYDAAHLHFGFTATFDAGVPKPYVLFAELCSAMTPRNHHI